VLGSGGPRGFAHIGVLKVLEENGIHPDLIVGSSVGAMAGAMYASGMKAAALEKMAMGLNLMEFFEVSTLGGGEASGGPIEKFVNECVHDRPLEALGTRFVVVATRARDHHLTLFNHGDTGRAVRASSASPGEFKPVPVGGELYIDGDEASPVPIRVAREMGAEVVIAVDVSAYVTETPPGVPRDWVVKDERRARQIAAEAPAADVLLHPDIGYYAGHSEAYRKRVIAAAESYTRSKMPEIRAALQKPSTARIPSGEASR
jgi:NTE family protein